MTGVLLALAAAGGVHLLYTAVARPRHPAGGALGSGGEGSGGPAARPRRRAVDRVRGGVARLRAGGARWLGVRLADLLAMAGVTAVVGGLVGALVFGAVLPASAVSAGAGALPVAAVRARRAEMRASAQETWPRLVEEVRIRIGSVGRSVPQALFEAGEGAPEILRPAFDAAHREWLLSTDFERTLTVLKARLADPTADATCETLLVAHDVGGTDLDRRLEALVEDRTLDVQGRKDARSRQAGVRFARRFVLLVPVGMAVAGMSIGTGRAAYATPWGQAMVTVGVVVVAGCWLWAGQLLRLPREERVFAPGPGTAR